MYHSERVLHPLRRTAGGGWERISWDAALDLVAERLRRALAEHGPLAVLAASYSGIHGWVARVLWRRFWAHAGGATLLRGGLSVEAALAAQELDMGADGTHEPEDLVNAAGFVVWGKNLAVTRQHALPFMKEARRAGGAAHVIDPVRTATARIADRWYQLRPGTDGVLAIGVGRLLIERGAIDEAFVRAHAQRLRGLPPARLSRTVAEVAPRDRPARRATSRSSPSSTPPEAARHDVGLGPVLLGERRGAGRLHRRARRDDRQPRRPRRRRGHRHRRATPGSISRRPGGAAQGGPRRTVLLPRLGEEVLAATDPPIRIGYVAGANPASMAPRTARVLEALRALEFLVVVEQFMSATAGAAHLVLPCTTYLEADDLVTAYGHNWIGLTQRVVRRSGEAKHRRGDPPGAGRAAGLRRRARGDARRSGSGSCSRRSPRTG